MIGERALFWNVLGEEEGYPFRLLEQQKEWYCRQDAAFRDRALCTSGVRLAFATDASLLRFSYEVVSFCRSCNVVDFYEDGVHTGSVRLADMQYRGEAVFERVTSGCKKIEIWLPNTCGLRITEVDFGDWQPVPRPKERLLILGDSIWQGIASYHPTCSVSNLMCRELGVEMINQSVGGACFFPEVLEPLPIQVDRILVALGINDVFSEETPERIEMRIHSWFDRLRSLYPQVPLTCITPVWTALLQKRRRQEKYARIVEVIRREAAEADASVIEGSGLLPHTERFYNEDDVHPNDLGFARYALSLIRYLKE